MEDGAPCDFPIPRGVVGALVRNGGKAESSVAPFGLCSLSPSIGAVMEGGPGAQHLPPFSRFASTRGRRLRWLHTDQRLWDGKLVRGEGGHTRLGMGMGSGRGASPPHTPDPPGPRSCWLSLEGGLLYAFVGPAAVIVLVGRTPADPRPLLCVVGAVVP